MLLTSGQVSLAISSTVAFIFTTALFLGGYAVQQQTVRDLRAAIKPQPKPIHTNLYVPPQPGATPAPSSDEGSAQQVIEVTLESSTEEQVQEPKELESNKETQDEEAGEKLVQNSDGAYVRVSRPRQRRRRIAEEQITRIYEKDVTEDVLGPRRSGRADDSTPDSRERLSRAARRKILKDDLKKLAGDEKRQGGNPYVYRSRRRLW